MAEVEPQLRVKARHEEIAAQRAARQSDGGDKAASGARVKGADFLKAIGTLAPGAVATGVVAAVDLPLVIGAAPLFAIGTLGVAGVLAGFQASKYRRR